MTPGPTPRPPLTVPKTLWLCKACDVGGQAPMEPPPRCWNCGEIVPSIRRVVPVMLGPMVPQ